MTPLARNIAHQFTLPKKKRDFLYDISDSRANTDAFKDIHCFECTEILPLLEIFAKDVREIKQFEAVEHLIFLPAPRTWLEWFPPNADPHAMTQQREREALLLVDRGDGWADVRWFRPGIWTKIGRISLTAGDYVIDHLRAFKVETGEEITDEYTEMRAHGLCALGHMFLILINTPRIIGRRQFMPQFGLERRLARALGKGKFPLHAWTEIKLEVAKPTEIDDGEPHEAHLTGRRALHFCRAHLRIRLGRLEYVSAHWRGDPAIGIKQSRYVVQP